MLKPSRSARLPQPRIAVRDAVLDDIPHLVAIEERAFETDRLSRRNFQHLLTRGHAACLVVTSDGIVAGYALLLFNSGTSLARLYSFAIDPAHGGRGLGRRLLDATEERAVASEIAYMRLEVRRDNVAAIRLYTSNGFEEFGEYPDYYEDHMAALRLEKKLRPSGRRYRSRVPYYRQTLEFTCGPAALMMAFKALEPDYRLDRGLELRLWREATTIFMTAGHGGCSPHGLALAADRRGFACDVIVSEDQPLFLESVRSPEKKEVMRIVHESFVEDLSRSAIRVHHGSLTVADMESCLEAGAIPLVLISSYRIDREKTPHWVVLTGYDDRYIFAHDPFIDEEANKSATDCVDLPILKRDFERMARYGRNQLKAAVIIRRGRES